MYVGDVDDGDDYHNGDVGDDDSDTTLNSSLCGRGEDNDDN